MIRNKVKVIDIAEKRNKQNFRFKGFSFKYEVIVGGYEVLYTNEVVIWLNERNEALKRFEQLFGDIINKNELLVIR